MNPAALASIILACYGTRAALGEIVHFVPPQPITATAELPSDNPGSNHAFALLDIDNDGAPEFTLNAIYQRIPVFAQRGTYLRVERPGAAARWTEGAGFEPLEAGTPVSTSDFFVSNEDSPFFLEVGLGGAGSWEYGAPPAFFGFRFDVNGQTHLGWARAQIEFHVEPVFAYSVTVIDYAYESVPGVPITAGQIPAPAALVVLGLGAFTSTRRRRP